MSGGACGCEASVKPTPNALPVEGRRNVWASRAELPARTTEAAEHLRPKKSDALLCESLGSSRLLPVDTVPRGTSDPSYELLFPGLGSIPVGGALPVTYWWHRAAAARACADHLTAPVVRPRPVWSLAEARRLLSAMEAPDSKVESPAGKDEDKAGTACGCADPVGPGGPPPPGFIDDLPEITPPSVMTCFEYGDLRFCVPTAWLATYISEGRASSAETVPDLLWSRFRARSGPSGATARSLLHCWNIGTSGPEPWSVFWPDGGPINFFETMVLLAAKYATAARDDFSGTDWCEQLPWFIERALWGARTTDRLGARCDLRIFVKSVDSRFNDDVSEGCLADSDADLEPCGMGFDRPEGRCGHPFDAWEKHWDATSAPGPHWHHRLRNPGRAAERLPKRRGAGRFFQRVDVSSRICVFRLGMRLADDVGPGGPGLRP